MYILSRASNTDTYIESKPYTTEEALYMDLETQFLAAIRGKADISLFPGNNSWVEAGWSTKEKGIEASITKNGAKVSIGDALQYWSVTRTAFPGALYSVRHFRDYGENEHYHNVDVFLSYKQAYADMSEDFASTKEQRLSESELVEAHCSQMEAFIMDQGGEFRWEIKKHQYVEPLS